MICTFCVVYPDHGGISHVPGCFTYDIKHDDEYTSTNLLSQKFRNLKKNIKRHLSKEIHINSVKEWNQLQKTHDKRETRVHSIGMRIARLCYAGYRTGSTKRNFEQEILRSVLNGVDLGDINHSKEFYSEFMPYVASQISARLKTYFSSTLEQTGYRPPVNVQADKGTNCHRTRQLTSCVTVVPDSPNLLNVLYLGQPVVKEHDGSGITKSIVGELQTWNLRSDQMEGGSFDGQYFHLSVPTHLVNQLSLPDQFLCTWDP